jgi:hypothetical protein
LRGEADGVDFWESFVLESFLLDDFVLEQPTFSPPSSVMDSEKMEAFGCGGFVGFSSITSDFVNRKHNDSRSMAGVEAGADEVVGMRDHSTGRRPDGGRREGYAVGNA